MAGAGDVDGDGVPDILAAGWIKSELGVPYGRVYIFSGLDGTLIKTVTSFEADDAFGYTVASLGDLNGDGQPEFAVAAPAAQTGDLADGAVYVFDLAAVSLMHMTTADALHTFTNASLSRDFFGSVIAYDDQQSTSSYHAILIGSVDPISYGSSPAQFIFSRHKLGTQQVLGETSVTSQSGGDVIPDGKVTNSDVDAVVTGLNQPARSGPASPDRDGDGFVTGADLIVVHGDYGATSPIHTLVSDPSPLVTRLAELTGNGGGLSVEPGDPQPWQDKPCNDDDDGDDDDGDGDDDDGPSIQPGFPGVQPGGRPISGPGGPARFAADPPTDGGDCDDDDDDGDDGCSGCDIPDGAPDDADCDAIARTSTPKHIGKGMRDVELSVELTSDEWAVSLSAGSSAGGAVIVGPVLQGTTEHTWAVNLAPDYVGEVELKWIASNANTNVIVTKCVSFNAVEYEPFPFTHAAFIPCDIVEGPPGPNFFVTDWYGGDNRVWCELQRSLPEFLRAGLTSTYRTKYRANVPCMGPIVSPIPQCYSILTPGELTLGNIPSSAYPPFGTSFGYNNGFPPVAVPVVCDNPPMVATFQCTHELAAGASPAIPPETQGAHFDWEAVPFDGPCGTPLTHTTLWPSANAGRCLFGVPFRTGPNKVEFRYRLAAKLPLIAVSPHIDAVVTADLTWFVDPNNGKQRIDYTFDISIDGYPAHEFFVGNTPTGLAWWYDPLPGGSTIDALWGDAGDHTAIVPGQYHVL